MPSHQVKEECPSCGALLIDTLQNRKALSESSQISSEIAPWDLSVELQTAYQQSSITFGFDIQKIDSLLNLNANGNLCIIGEQKRTQLLINRLCVHTLLPRRYGDVGLDFSKIIAIDAGNCTDVYQFVDFARQYRLEVKRVLQNIVVSRVFTIYHLADLIVHELPKFIQRFSSKNKIIVIVIYGLLHLFVSDPHIDRTDAKHLIKKYQVH